MKTLITGAFPLDDNRRRLLEQRGLDIVFHQDERVAVENPWQYEAVICNGLFTFQDIQGFTGLKYIQLTSAGFDRLPMEYIKKQGIVIHNARNVYSIPMAEFALGGVLQLYKQFSFFQDNQKAHRWEKHRGLQELAGKTLCILGCGSVGSACAKRFSAFDCNVIGLDIIPGNRNYFSSVYPMDDLSRILPDADIVLLTLPLTPETRGLISSDHFKIMKPGAVLVNISRGAVVDTCAMIRALESHLGGAVLDVFEEEPLPADSPLWDMKNVIITPHNSFVGEGNGGRILQLLHENIHNWRKK